MFDSPTRYTLAALMLAAAACASVGCQERVVNERYVPHTGMGRETAFYPESPHAPPPTISRGTTNRRSMWDKLGDALFGWTEIFTGDDDDSADSQPKTAASPTPQPMRPVSPSQGSSPRSPSPTGSGSSQTSSPDPLWRGYGDQQ